MSLGSVYHICSDVLTRFVIMTIMVSLLRNQWESMCYVRGIEQVINNYRFPPPISAISNVTSTFDGQGVNVL